MVSVVGRSFTMESGECGFCLVSRWTGMLLRHYSVVLVLGYESTSRSADGEPVTWYMDSCVFFQFPELALNR